jgi:cytochrome c oxidase assembly protein subunit 15
VAATLNLLIIGSLIGRGSTTETLRNFALWALGNYGLSIALGAVGGVLGASVLRRADVANQSSSNDDSNRWFALFTRVAAVTVFLLLITGGLVTGLEAGLAVPDWPNSFGHNMLLYPLSEMVGGVYYEHAHRLYGMLVGVTAITLAVATFIFDQRGWLRGLAIGYLIMVCAQGILGGTRVAATSVPLAIIHGVFGQIVFATICAIAAFTSRTWTSERTPDYRDSARSDRTWTTALLACLIVQLALGAMYRHTFHKHVLYTHILTAAIVLGLSIFVGGRAWGRNADLPVLPRVGKAVLHTVGLQLALGVVALIAVLSRDSVPPTVSGEATPLEQIPLWEVVFTTAHQATGALLLALATLLMLWTRRLLAPATA